MEQAYGVQDMWNKVEQILINKKITIYRLSKMTGIPKTTIESYKYKHSQMSFINACKIADALEISLEDLRGDEKDEIEQGN